MKKAIYLIIIFSFVLFLYGCGNKTELTSDEFKLLMSNKNYSTYDDNSNTITEDTSVISFTSASKDNVGFGFIVFKNESAAKYLFEDYKNNEDGKNKKTESYTNLFNYNKYSYSNDEEYYSLIRVGKTILITNATVDQEDEVKSIIEELGY